jgi:hypothetical protein
VNARFSCLFCNFEKNTNAGALIKDGFNHFFGWSNFPADGVQLFGVNSDPPAGANFSNVQVTLIGNVFGSNLTRDAQFSVNQHTGVIYPQATASSGFTLLDSSSNVVLFDIAANALKLPSTTLGNTISGNGSDLSIQQRSGGTNIVNFTNSSGIAKASVDPNGKLTTGSGGLSINSGTALTGQVGSGTSVATNTSVQTYEFGCTGDSDGIKHDSSQ